MTVDELFDRIARLKVNYRRVGEWQVTVAKHDDRQLSSHTTVPVEGCHAGFDWTANQLIIEPAFPLVTKKKERQHE